MCCCLQDSAKRLKYAAIEVTDQADKVRSMRLVLVYNLLCVVAPADVPRLFTESAAEV